MWGARARGRAAGWGTILVAAAIIALATSAIHSKASARDWQDGSRESGRPAGPEWKGWSDAGSQIAQSTSDQRVYDIPAQPLAGALTLFGQQSGLQVTVDGALVRDLSTPGISGTMTIEQALAGLLAGSGLTYRLVGGTTVAIRPNPREDSGPLRLGPVIVVGDKIGRTAAETAPSIRIIDGEEADRPINRDIKSVVRGTANVLSEEGIQLPAIRGIDGTAGLRQAFTAGTQPRVPVLIDGVARPLSNSFAISRSSTWDVSVVEVARGPQPSSTGRNALAGAIRVYTNEPSDDYEVAARMQGFTARGTVEGAGMVNLPIVEDQLAFRGTFEESRGESYVDVIDPTRFTFDPEEEVFRRYRGKLRFSPEMAPGLEVNFTADHIRTEGPIPGFVDGDTDDLQIANFAFGSTYEENDQTTLIGRGNYAFNDFAELELRTSYLRNDLLFPDTGAGFGNFSILQKEWEGEAFLRLNDLGVLQRAVTGGIHNNATEDGVSDSLLFGFTTDGTIKNTGLYAEAEFSLGALGLIEDLTLIAGGRYEIDDRERTVTIRNNPVSGRDLSERRFLPKAGVRYSPFEALTLGYTYSEAFRAGGVDVDLTGGFFGMGTVNFSEFDPESLKQHEIYAKASLWDGRATLGASAFYYIYEDAQVPGASTQPSAGGGNLFGNVPEARGKGLEIETSVDVTDSISFSGALGLLDTEITETGPVLTAFDGEELPRAPNVTASVGLNFQSEYGFHARADARFVGSTNSGLGQPSLGSYPLFDLAAGYEFETEYGGFRIEAFVENVTDERYFTFRERTATLGFDGVGRPRTFGAAATFRF